jgi:hypothetical protein
MGPKPSMTGVCSPAIRLASDTPDLNSSDIDNPMEAAVSRTASKSFLFRSEVGMGGLELNTAK